MSRFLIEVPHEGTRKACVRAIEIFHQTGSHFLTHADWGCHDGVHTAWFTVDVESKDDARLIVPPSLRPVAKIVQLNAFTEEDLANLLREHDS